MMQLRDFGRQQDTYAEPSVIHVNIDIKSVFVGLTVRSWSCNLSTVTPVDSRNYSLRLKIFEFIWT